MRSRAKKSIGILTAKTVLTVVELVRMPDIHRLHLLNASLEAQMRENAVQLSTTRCFSAVSGSPPL